MRRWVLGAGAVGALALASCQLVFDYQPFAPVDPGDQLCALYDADPGDCAGSFRDCNGDDADACETDVASAADHCGHCGHTCAEGCDGGACALEPLGVAQSSEIRALGVSGDSVYFTLYTTDSGIHVLSPSGEVLIEAFGSDSYFAFDDMFLYATGYQPPLCAGVGWCVLAVALGDTQPSVLAQTDEYPYGLAVGESGVFFADPDEGGRVVRVDKSGGDPETVAAGLGEVRAMASTVGHVVWGGAAGLMRIADAGGEVEMLAQGDVTAVASDGDAIYWAADGAIQRRAAEGAIETLVDGLSAVSWIGASGAYLYWNDGALTRRVLCASGENEVVGESGPAFVTADHLYATIEQRSRPVRRQH